MNPAVQGTETWISNTENGDSASAKLAQTVQEKVVAVTGYRNRGVKAESPDPSGVLDPLNHHFETAISLVEISFLTNPEDEARLTNVALGEQYKMLLAEAISFAVFDNLRTRGFL
jgi:N-acetylmuramoyl-L-alanine amidase